MKTFSLKIQPGDHMQFEFVTSDRIIFGNGALSKLITAAQQMGQHALIVCGSGSVALDPLLYVLEHAGVESDIFRIAKEPDIPTVEAGVRFGKSAGCDFVIGYGGGSSLDGAKAIAAMLNNPGGLMDYLEVIGGGKEIPNPSLPMIAIPTTAGTGTEVTRNAVISSPEKHVKVSMRSVKMIPRLAVVDPELTYSMPPSVTASTGMDALTQVIEAYVSLRANPMTDAIAREGIQRGGRSLLNAYQNGANTQAREDMAVASLFGGLALANSGLGAVHGFAGPIGGMFDAPHGVICACLLPAVMKVNAIALDEDEEGGEGKRRYRAVAQMLTGVQEASISEGVAWVAALAKDLNIPGLHAMGIKKSDFPAIIEKAKVSSSMKSNLVRLTDGQLLIILEESF